MLNFLSRIIPPQILFGAIFMAMSVIGGVWFVVDLSLRGLEVAIVSQSSQMGEIERRIQVNHQELLHEVRTNRARISEVMVEAVRAEGQIAFVQSSIDRAQGQINGLQNSPFDENPSNNIRIQTDEGRTFVLELPPDAQTSEILNAFIRGNSIEFLLNAISEDLERGVEPDAATLQRLRTILDQLGDDPVRPE